MHGSYRISGHPLRTFPCLAQLLGAAKPAKNDGKSISMKTHTVTTYTRIQHMTRIVRIIKHKYFTVFKQIDINCLVLLHQSECSVAGQPSPPKGYIPKGDPLPQVETVKGHQNQHQSTKELAASSHKWWCSYFHTHGRRVSDEIKTSSFKLLIPSIFIDDRVGKPCLHKHLSEMYYPSSRNSLLIKVHPKLREQVPQASQQVPQAS